MNHTATPWNVLEEGSDLMIIGKASHIATVPIGSRADEPSDRANAAHIVRCVNAHDELVAALDEMLAAHEMHEPPTRQAVEVARAALAKARA